MELHEMLIRVSDSSDHNHFDWPQYLLTHPELAELISRLGGLPVPATPTAILNGAIAWVVDAMHNFGHPTDIGYQSERTGWK